MRLLEPERLGALARLAVMDVSFISLRLVLPPAIRCLEPGGLVLALVKPQFEAGRDRVRRGGRVNDPAVHAQVLDAVRKEGEALGLETLGAMESPLPGKKSGNREFFLLWRTSSVLASTAAIGAVVNNGQ
jgi:23S rRNA (cytidine1920-2'-O)/16S rRNA (cytidine1409-2'-O)-methyltransferase